MEGWASTRRCIRSMNSKVVPVRTWCPPLKHSVGTESTTIAWPVSLHDAVPSVLVPSMGYLSECRWEPMITYRTGRKTILDEPGGSSIMGYTPSPKCKRWCDLSKRQWRRGSFQTCDFSFLCDLMKNKNIKLID